MSMNTQKLLNIFSIFLFTDSAFTSFPLLAKKSSIIFSNPQINIYSTLMVLFQDTCRAERLSHLTCLVSDEVEKGDTPALFICAF